MTITLLVATATMSQTTVGQAWDKRGTRTPCATPLVHWYKLLKLAGWQPAVRRESNGECLTLDYCGGGLVYYV